MAIPLNYIAYYKLLMNADDETGNYNGTNNGATFLDGNGAYFDASSDIEILANGNGSDFCSQTFSLSVWIIPEELASKGTIFSYAYSAVFATTNDLDRLGASFATALDGFSKYVNTPYEVNIPTDSWTHLAVTIKSGSQKIYVNGVLLDEENYPGSVTYYDQKVIIGSSDVGDNSFLGNIRDLAFYDRVVTDAEVWDLYQDGIPPLEFIDFDIVSENHSMTMVDLNIVSEDGLPTLIDFDIVSDDSLPTFIDFDIVSDNHKGYIASFDIVSEDLKDPEFVTLNIISDDIPSEAESPQYYTSQVIRRVL